MCIAPSFEYVWVAGIRTAEQITTPCGECWQCKKQRVNDFVGRMLCERAQASATACITLTYANKPEREVDLAHKRLTPRHFQNFVKHLRWQGYSLKYFTAGEYGKAKGRAHFHSLLFFKPTPRKPKPPQWINQQNIHIGPAWDHGHAYVDWEGTVDACRYVCKYILKTDSSENWVSMSKRPYLGYEFAQQMAARNIETKTPPVTFNYRPPGEPNTKTKYWLQGAAKRDYCLKLYDDWLEQIGPFPWERIPLVVAKAIERALIWRMKKEAFYPSLDIFMQDMKDTLRERRVSTKKTDYFWDEETARQEYEARALTNKILGLDGYGKKTDKTDKKNETFKAKEPRP